MMLDARGGGGLFCCLINSGRAVGNLGRWIKNTFIHFYYTVDMWYRIDWIVGL